MEGKTLCNGFLTFKISVIQVLLQLQEGSRKFIEILGISLADSNETFPFKFCNRDHQRRRDKRNQNVDTWNPQYGFKVTKSRRIISTANIWAVRESLWSISVNKLSPIPKLESVSAVYKNQ